MPFTAIFILFALLVLAMVFGRMIEEARMKCEEKGLTDRVHFKQGNAKELPYQDATRRVM